MKNKYRYFLYPILVLIIIAAFIFKTNADIIYGKIANNYYKKNNIDKAKLFYERAINLNRENSGIRESYVKMLIKQPLTVNIQESLVKIAEDDVDDSAKYIAEGFLSEIKQNIHKKYPYNYILQAPYNQKIVHWGKLPITYSYASKNVPEEIINGINDAFEEWGNVADGIISFKEVSTGGNILIDFISSNIKDIEVGEKYTVAYTTPTVSSNSLLNMCIKFNIKDIEGNIYSQNQIYNTALHEIFHALGFMGHSYDRNNIMHMSKDNYSILKDTKRILTTADISTMKLLYKTKPDITNSNELVYEYVPYIIVGNMVDRNYSKTREAKNYIKNAPTLPNGYLDYAETLVTQKKYSEAVKCLKKAFEYANNDDAKYLIYYDLAVCYYYLESYSNAEKCLEAAMKIKDDSEMHYLRAEIYLKKNDTEKAISEYNYLLSEYPENIDYLINLANIYIKKRNYIKARKIIKNFIKNNPNEKNNPKLSAYNILKF